jgi:Transposase IS4
MVDPRRVVGNPVWAKAMHVSRDCRRIYGADVDKMWLRGTVLECMTSKPDGARRATTLIKASYQVGNGERVKIINIAQLKKDNPNPRTEQEEPAGPARSSSATSSPQNLEQSSASQEGPPQTPTVTTGQAVPETVGTRGSSSTSSSQRPVATVHEMDWFDDDTTSYPTNGSFPRRTWKLFCQYTDREFTPGCDPEGKISVLEFFMAVFPKEQLKKMVEETSDALRVNGHPKLTKGELLKWFGVLLLVTRFEFGERKELWSTTSRCKFIPAPNFGERTGMTRDRFHTLFRYMVWSTQPSERPDGMSSEAYRWLLVEDFVKNFNDHRASFFSPGWQVCVDESMSRWYGLGGHWINIGLPMYVAMDRKPEDGLEIQNACCAQSGIMLQIKLVKTAEANALE